MSVYWTMVVPVKGTSDAKSRLEASEELAMAIALDTVDAALGAAHVIVVTSHSVAHRFRALGAEVVPDPGGGLDGAIDAGIAAATKSRRAAHGVGVLLGDLPALTSGELMHALTLASAHPRSMVADADNTGTVLITALAKVAHTPAFGSGSRAAHLAAGYIELVLSPTSGLRRDVDTPEQLASLAGESLGPRTGAALCARAVVVSSEMY